MNGYYVYGRKNRVRGVPTVNQSGNISANYTNNGIMVIRYFEVGLYQHDRSRGISGNSEFINNPSPASIMGCKHD